MIKGEIFRVNFQERNLRFEVDLWDDGYGKDYWMRLVQGEYEPDTVALINKFSAHDKCFIDVGAANGAMSLIAASLGCEVIAVEPNKQVFSVLQRNVLLNVDLSTRIHLTNAILASEEEKIEGNESIFQRGLLTEITQEGTNEDTFKGVKIVDLKEILSFSSRQKYIIKIDIEGAEWRLFQSMKFIQELKNRHITVIIALHPGLHRPLNGYTRTRNNLFRRPKCFWQLLNITDAIRFFNNVSEFNVYRTNFSLVKDVKKFVSLVLGGNHEFILIPKT